MKFLDFVESYCKENKIELMVSNKNRVNCYSIECNGFFDAGMPIDMKKIHVYGEEKYNGKNLSTENKMVLAYSTGNKTNEEILSLVAHEFGHANQYLELSPLWVNNSDFLIWDEYFSESKFKMSKVKKAWSKIVKLEADCEQRVLQFIDRFKLEIDKEKYAQKANAYLYFYMFALNKRKWYSKAPYEIENIVNKMPKKIFDLNYYVDLNNEEIISKEKMFEECFV